MLSPVSRPDPALHIMFAFLKGSVIGASLSLVLFDSSQRVEVVAFTAFLGLVSAVCASVRLKGDCKTKAVQIAVTAFSAFLVTGAVVGVLNKLLEPEPPLPQNL